METKYRSNGISDLHNACRTAIQFHESVGPIQRRNTIEYTVQEILSWAASRGAYKREIRYEKQSESLIRFVIKKQHVPVYLSDKIDQIRSHLKICLSRRETQYKNRRQKQKEHYLAQKNSKKCKKEKTKDLMSALTIVNCHPFQ